VRQKHQARIPSAPRDLECACQAGRALASRERLYGATAGAWLRAWKSAQPGDNRALVRVGDEGARALQRRPRAFPLRFGQARLIALRTRLPAVRIARTSTKELPGPEGHCKWRNRMHRFCLCIRGRAGAALLLEQSQEQEGRNLTGYRGQSFENRETLLANGNQAGICEKSIAEAASRREDHADERIAGRLQPCSDTLPEEQFSAARCACARAALYLHAGSVHSFPC
jgi:hypothetical protein